MSKLNLTIKSSMKHGLVGSVVQKFKFVFHKREPKDLNGNRAPKCRRRFKRHRLKRLGDHNSRSKALNDLQKFLNLPNSPLRIECYDMSHLQGSNYVGSMVVMEDAILKKKDYRKFKIKSIDGNDDYAAMAEVVRRRLMNLLKEESDQSNDASSFSYLLNFFSLMEVKGSFQPLLQY
ncbi:MAG: hypothetical protein CM15mP49_02470 [Actinomycetota bacterium]|nr:MAG: hypothetical protein CM15mP49_02470 [Actinomycetota bacterium]